VVDFVIASAATETFYSPSDITNRLIDQLGLISQNKPVINVKVQRVDAYVMPTGASTDRPAVSMDVSSVTPGIGDPATPGAAEVFYGILKKLSDQGNLSDAAKVSYSWPRHMADLPLSSQANFQLVGVAGNLANTTVRFHLLWSTTDIGAPQ
jgi:BRCT domain type II-containing protein